MFRSAIACLLLATAISASIPFGNIDKIPADVKALIPKEVTDFYKGLTDADKAVLKDLGTQAKEFKTEEEALEALKGKSASLHLKAKAIYDLVKSKIEALDTEAKTFIKETVDSLRVLRPATGEAYNLPKVKETARNVIANYKKLSEAAKDDLKKQFPQITALIKNEKVQSFAKGLLEKN